MRDTNIEHYLNKTKTRNIIVLVFVLAFTLRFGAIFYFSNLDDPDMHEFGVIAQNLIHGKGYSFYSIRDDGNVVAEFLLDNKALPSAYMPPGYPFFLAGFFSIFGVHSYSILIIVITQAILGSLICVFLYLIVKFKFSEKTALTSSIILAVYPAFVYLPSQISAANLYIFLNIILIYLLIKGEKEEKLLYFIFSGIIMGLLIFTRAQLIGYLPFIGTWIFIISVKNKLRKSLIFAIIALLIITPWTIRNYKTFHKFIPVIKSTGYNLWRGNNKYSSGAWHTKMSQEMKDKISNLSLDTNYEINKDNIFMEEALNFIKDNPFGFLKLSIKKFTYYWGYFWGMPLNYPGVKSPLYWFPWMLMFPFLVLGITKTSKEFMKYSIFYMYFILATAVAMGFFVLPRYRMFIVPFVIPFAVHGTFELIKNKKT